MKTKLKKLLVAILAIGTIGITGCDVTEEQLVIGAETAGELTMLTWFSIDNPDAEVKAVLKEVIGKITSASVKVGEGETYLEAVLPEIQDFVLKRTDLNEYQKALINSGSVIVLNGIDMYLDKNEKVKENVVLVNKVVGAFGKGCLKVLAMEENSLELRKARSVYRMRSMKCRGGRFVSEQ